MDVRELIRQRAAEKSQPGARTDPHRLALCIEGGAMRGVVSGGMVSELEERGLLHVFDAVYGSSAGAMNGAFFVAGQAAFGTTIYYEFINNARFIGMCRALGRRPIVDLDFLVWEVMRGPRRLDVVRVLESRIGLRTIATDTTTGERTVFSEWSGGDDLLASLRAGASMAVVAGPPYAYAGGTYWDAALSEPIPARSAEEDGFTHLLVLLTRPAGTGGPELSIIDRLFIVPRIRAVSDALARRYVERGRAYLDVLQSLAKGRGPLGRAVALAVAPEAPGISKLERSQERLIAGAEAGRRAIARALG